jgi:hypothetical protein
VTSSHVPPAEQIVRALAAADLAQGGDQCRLCGPAGFEPESLADHEPDCPWRLAVEWVAAQDRDDDAAERRRLSAARFNVLATVAHAPDCKAPQGSCSPRCRFLPVAAQDQRRAEPMHFMNEGMLRNLDRPLLPGEPGYWATPDAAVMAGCEHRYTQGRFVRVEGRWQERNPPIPSRHSLCLECHALIPLPPEAHRLHDEIERELAAQDGEQ